ncbi:carbohydrate-binding protein [Methylomonas sp. LL1]|uniref:carbohydrate-binding protein n=1 Tax=Methylomonas sp. LL1 TaxID=2785785 RepID=UPI001E5569DB|nr:carbohydrate-binding protein [Methylomonas sp. LL1]
MAEPDWLNLDRLAEVEVSSEDPDFPIESALLPGLNDGWRASEAGKQTIRLIFTEPQSLFRIRLEFVETEIERRQEYVLRWSADAGQTFQEIVRQQWNFSPTGSTQEIEDYRIELNQVGILELSIDPDGNDGQAIASLARLQLA